MKGLLDSSLLRSVNKLREFWQNHRNALVIDEVNQERIAIMIAFTLSLIKDFHINRPILIITSTAGIYCWESEFLRWASSINMVAYCGNRESRDIIRKLEFSEESGCVLVQIVLSTSDVVTADLDSLICLDWEAVIVDEGQRLKLSKVFQHLEQLSADFRLVLFHEQLKDNAPDVSHLLAFLDSDVLITLRFENNARVCGNDENCCALYSSFIFNFIRIHSGSASMSNRTKALKTGNTPYSWALLCCCQAE